MESNMARTSMARALGCLAALLFCADAGVASADPAAPGPGPYKVVQAIPGEDVFWDYAAIVPEEHRLYLARENGVSVLDLTTGQLTAQFVAGRQVHAVVPLPGGQALFTQGAVGLVTVFDRATGKVVRDIAVGTKPDGAVRDPATGQVIVVDGSRDEAIFVDPDKGAVLGRIKV